jgi:hypothetical protein
MTDDTGLPDDSMLEGLADAISDVFETALPDPVGFGLFVFDHDGNGRLITNTPKAVMMKAVRNWLEHAEDHEPTHRITRLMQ